MIVRRDGGGEKGGRSGEEERKEDGSELVSNRTDQEKMVIKQTSLLLKVLRVRMGVWGWSMEILWG